ncbi:MAG: hypothetical protein JSV39_04740, partial [Candidatus Aenigmatarchaeota archaeon]
WKSFLIGSLTVSSLIYLVLTEDIGVFFAALGLVVIGAILFLGTVLSIRKVVYFSQNIFFLAIGGIFSIIFNAAGYSLLYLGVVVILVVVTWMHKFRIKGK